MDYYMLLESVVRKRKLESRKRENFTLSKVLMKAGGRQKWLARLGSGLYTLKVIMAYIPTLRMCPHGKTLLSIQSEEKHCAEG